CGAPAALQAVSAARSTADPRSRSVPMRIIRQPSPRLPMPGSVRHRMAILPWLRTATAPALRCRPAVPKGNGPVSDDPDSSDKPRSGRVRHDSGGRAIWEWAIDSGKHAVDSTSRLLKRLELTGITLMGDEA